MKLLIIGMILALSGLTAEVDQFTRRHRPLADQSDIINLKANNYMNQAIVDANKKFNCQTDKKASNKLYKELRKYFNNHLSGKFVKELMHNKNIITDSISTKDSVYESFALLDGVFLSINKVSDITGTTSPEIKIGDQKVGIDKFEHFFGQGYFYFNDYYHRGKSLKKVLLNGASKESWMLGGAIYITGVFSYADLSANFNGMRFWNHILQHNPDILGNNLGPYIECVDGKYKKVANNPVDFTNYMDSSMDEGINCSKFATKRGQKVFDQKLSDLNMSCPVEPQILDDMKEKYNLVKEYIFAKDSI